MCTRALADELVRDASGRCIPCTPGETGELVSYLTRWDSSGLTTFAGYHGDRAATEKKLARGVFRGGDTYYRSGDLLRMSPEGRFYFVDRIGDTYRWHGENVATTEVAEALGEFPAVLDAIVRS